MLQPEFDQFPIGYVTARTPYIRQMPPWGTNQTIQLKGAYPQNANETAHWDDQHYGPNYFAGAYRMGEGGGCDYLTPSKSYWCQPDGRTAGHTYFAGVRPAGVHGINKFLPHTVNGVR